MEFFKRYFTDVNFDRDQVRVACPFHNDENPSASINTVDSLFYCPVCNEGYNEVQFVSRLNNISLIESTKVIDRLQNTQTTNWGIIEKAELWGDTDFLSEVKKLANEETIDLLGLGLTYKNNKKYLGIPIYYNGVIMDVKNYNLLKHSGSPKMIGDKGGENGHVFPHDLWIKSEGTTYILEGEKDVIVARNLGINAITITGGANALPNSMVINSFKDKDIVLCYDNDDAGYNGMVNMFKKLHNVVKSIKFIDISEVVPEDKGDFADAVFKYGMDDFLFETLPQHEFPESILHETKTNYVSIKDSLRQNRLRKNLRSIVNVSAEYSDMFALPIIVEIEKVNHVGNESSNSLAVGTKINWYFDKEQRLSQLLELVEFNAKKDDITKKIIQYMGIPSSEKGLKVTIKQYETVYKYKVVDANTRLVENDSDNINNTVLDLYSFDKMDIGVEYDIGYTLLPHPFKNQIIMAVANDVIELDLGVNFRIEKDKLQSFQTKGTIRKRVDKLYQSAKHHIAKHLDYNMWLMSDLVMNSILEIDYGGPTWGALDVFILGDTATGKSEVTKGLVELYDFGHFLSLKTATTIGLIGGSKKEGESMVNTIGAIPRQHKKLVVMEEFSGSNPAFIKTMTDIRTTRRVHIIRISGELSVACNLRMITISNPLGDDRGMPKFLSTFPNGVQPLMELINNPEDVGRYDGFILMPQIESRFNPFMYQLEGSPIPEENYKYKSKWVYTRNANNIVYEEGVEAYIWEKAEELNQKYESNFPLFGTKASLKLARFSIALASQIVNTDETYENIIVSKEIVDFVVNYFNKIYDNPVFKLADYKREYDSYNVVNQFDIDELQKIYPQHSNIIEYLEGTSSTNLENLRANSALDMKDFNVLYTKLSQLKFIRSLGRSIVPTSKFRKAVANIDKTFTTGAGMEVSAAKTFMIEGDDIDGL